MMVPRCTFSIEKLSGGFQLTCVCDDKLACSMVQNLCTLLAGGLCSCCCTLNGITYCICNFTMGVCRLEMTDRGFRLICTSGDQSCSEMIQACADCLNCCMDHGCTCCLVINSTPVCVGITSSNRRRKVGESGDLGRHGSKKSPKKQKAPDAGESHRSNCDEPPSRLTLAQPHEDSLRWLFESCQAVERSFLAVHLPLPTTASKEDDLVDLLCTLTSADTQAVPLVLRSLGESSEFIRMKALESLRVVCPAVVNYPKALDALGSLLLNDGRAEQSRFRVAAISEFVRVVPEVAEMVVAFRTKAMKDKEVHRPDVDVPTAHPRSQRAQIPEIQLPSQLAKPIDSAVIGT